MGDGRPPEHGHPHVHIALRGAGGLRLPRGYVKRGLRRHAEELCTAQLGYRTELDVREAERREVSAQHPTSLDRRIARLADGDAVPPLLGSRLRTLERMGLARSAGGRWTLRPDFLVVLRAMKKATDRQKMLATHAGAISNARLPVVYVEGWSAEVEGRVVGHALDEGSGVAHMIVEGRDRIWLVRHDAAVESARRAGRLGVGSVVNLRTPSEGTRKNWLGTKRVVQR